MISIREKLIKLERSAVGKQVYVYHKFKVIYVPAVFGATLTRGLLDSGYKKPKSGILRRTDSSKGYQQLSAYGILNV